MIVNNGHQHAGYAQSTESKCVDKIKRHFEIIINFMNGMLQRKDAYVCECIVTGAHILVNEP